MLKALPSLSSLGKSRGCDGFPPRPPRSPPFPRHRSRPRGGSAPPAGPAPGTAPHRRQRGFLPPENAVLDAGGGCPPSCPPPRGWPRTLCPWRRRIPPSHLGTRFLAALKGSERLAGKGAAWERSALLQIPFCFPKLLPSGVKSNFSALPRVGLCSSHRR